ncbi:MAG: hypothetical protein ACFB20_01000 [Opitutales bacterium]
MKRLDFLPLLALSSAPVLGALVSDVPPTHVPNPPAAVAVPDFSQEWLELSNPDGETLRARLHDFIPRDEIVRLYLRRQPTRLMAASLSFFSEGSQQIIRDWHNRRIIQQNLRFDRDRRAGKRNGILYVTYPFSVRNNTFHTMRDIEVRYVVDSELHSVENYRLVDDYRRSRRVGVFHIDQLKDGGRWEQATDALPLREFTFERVTTRHINGLPVSEIDQKVRRERLRGKWFGIYYRGELLQEYSDPDAFAPIARRLAAEQDFAEGRQDVALTP